MASLVASGSCPNRANPHHVCSEFCASTFGGDDVVAAASSGLETKGDDGPVVRQVEQKRAAVRRPVDDLDAWLARGYADISGDGGVLKKLVRAGAPREGRRSGEEVPSHREYLSPDERPVEGCPVVVQHVGRLLDGRIYDTSRDVVDGKHAGGTDDPFEFILGRNKVVEGWDVAIATMLQGELSTFVMSASYAYGDEVCAGCAGCVCVCVLVCVYVWGGGSPGGDGAGMGPGGERVSVRRSRCGGSAGCLAKNHTPPCWCRCRPEPAACLQQPRTRLSPAMHYRIHHTLPHITYVLIISRTAHHTPHHTTTPHRASARV